MQITKSKLEELIEEVLSEEAAGHGCGDKPPLTQADMDSRKSPSGPNAAIKKRRAWVRCKRKADAKKAKKPEAAADPAPAPAEEEPAAAAAPSPTPGSRSVTTVDPAGKKETEEVPLARARQKRSDMTRSQRAEYEGEEAVAYMGAKLSPGQRKRWLAKISHPRKPGTIHPKLRKENIINKLPKQWREHYRQRWNDINDAQMQAFAEQGKVSQWLAVRDKQIPEWLNKDVAGGHLGVNGFSRSANTNKWAGATGTHGKVGGLSAGGKWSKMEEKLTKSKLKGKWSKMEEKLTKSKLKELIKEELDYTLEEQDDPCGQKPTLPPNWKTIKKGQPGWDQRVAYRKWYKCKKQAAGGGSSPAPINEVRAIVKLAKKLYDTGYPISNKIQEAGDLDSATEMRKILTAAIMGMQKLHKDLMRKDHGKK